MILDTSAIIAILAKEPDFELYIEAISRAPAAEFQQAISSNSRSSSRANSGAEVLRQSDALFRRIEVAVEPVTFEQAQVARQAFHDFGRRRHPAGLNFGDCFAYALAKVTGEPMLFKGGDFKRTDIISAL